MPDHGGWSHDTKMHLIDMQGMVPGKEVAHTTKIHAGHVGKIEDDVTTGSLLSLLKYLLKGQGVKGIQMP